MDALIEKLRVLSDAVPSVYVEQYRTFVGQNVLPVWKGLEPRFLELETQAEIHMSVYSRGQIAILSALATLAFMYLIHVLLATVRAVRTGAVSRKIFAFVRALPGISHELRNKQEEVRKKVRESMPPVEDPTYTLPQRGCPANLLLEKLKLLAKKDLQIPDGNSMLSGTVYINSSAHKNLLDQTYALFSSSNPLHASVFPSVVQMEREVIAMTAKLMGGGPEGNSNVCGAMTSGGTESILTAIKASRDYMKAVKGITQPEMIVAVSAHAAYFKAAEYFNIKLVMLAVDSNYQLAAAAVRRNLTRNTVVVVASAPGYPHGVVDPIVDIAKVTRRAGVCLHVDACLGGFVLPFAQKLGYPIPAFGFGVDGVTSMSVDTHKYGMAHKGTSVVLYNNPKIRQHQYTSIVNWTGGLYISPGFAGSRAGGLIATAWASLVHMGEEGFLRVTDEIMKAATRFKQGVAAIPELEVVGRPDAMVVAFKSRVRAINVYQVHQLMSTKGWHFNTLQFPAALHFCFTGQNVGVVDDMLKDLRESVAVIKAAPDTCKGGEAALYGLSHLSPDRDMVGQFLVVYQDAVLG